MTRLTRTLAWLPYAASLAAVAVLLAYPAARAMPWVAEAVDEWLAARVDLGGGE